MVIGKSNLYRKSDMEKCGGMRQFAKYMAEDNEIGKSIMNLGKTHCIAHELAYQSMGQLTFSEFLFRRIRWIRIRKYCVPNATFIEPFTECFLHSFISSILFSEFFHISQAYYASLLLILFFCSDLIMLILTYSPVMHRPTDIIGMAAVWALRESIALLVYIAGIIGTEITWRGAQYYCNADGTGTPVNKAKRIWARNDINQESDIVEFLSTSKERTTVDGSLMKCD